MGEVASDAGTVTNGGSSHLHEGFPKILLQPPGQPLRHVGNLVCPPPPGDGAFPHHRHPPAPFQQLLHHLPVPPPVALQLVPPEFRVGAGQAELGAVAVGVPEAAVHKDDGTVAGQHNVGASCQAAVVLAEAEAVAVELGADLPLRPVLRAADAGHGVMALLRSHGVHGDEYTTFALREEWIPLLLLKCPSIARISKKWHYVGMNILLQIGIVIGICLVGECISALLPFILPGNIIAMILIFILLLTHVMKIDHIRQKALFLKQNMAFFLVPSSVSIIQHIDLLKEIVIPLLVISMVSTILTFLATAFAVNLTMKLTQKKSTRSSPVNKGAENE